MAFPAEVFHIVEQQFFVFAAVRGMTITAGTLPERSVYVPFLHRAFYARVTLKTERIELII